MVTTKDLCDAVKAAGWDIVSGAFFHWLNNNTTIIISQETIYGYSAFRFTLKNEEIVGFEALKPSW